MAFETNHDRILSGGETSEMDAAFAAADQTREIARLKATEAIHLAAIAAAKVSLKAASDLYLPCGASFQDLEEHMWKIRGLAREAELRLEETEEEIARLSRVEEDD